MRSRGVAALAAASLLSTLGVLGTATPAPAAGPDTGLRVTGEGVPDAGPAARRATPGGTIVLIKDHDVWLVRPDGSGLTRVTRDGTAAKPYEAPTMSDTGVIAVARGGVFHLLRQNGQGIATWKPAELFLPDSSEVIRGPAVDPVISADGTRLAYSQARTIRDWEGKLRTQALTGFIDTADASMHSIEIGYEPSWITRSRVVLNGNGDVDLFTLGSEEGPTTWFHGDEVMPEDDDPFTWYETSDPEVSPDRQFVTFLLAGGRVVALAKVNGDPATSVPPTPDQASCFVNEDGEPEEPSFESPSWGPDSRSVAFASPEGVEVVTDFHLCGGGADLRTIVPGGSEPDWADVALDPGPAAFTLDRKPAVKGKPKVGKVLTADAGAWTPAPTAVAYQWLRNGKAVKGATGRSYKLKKADRGRPVAVRVTVRRDGYRAATATSSAVRVR